jgi:cellulose biosynthesis protein BcsQ
VTGLLTRRRNGASSPSAVDVPLAFDRTGGPLVAVCGLVGGAGTSTLAFLLAREAARRSSVPVLLAELADHGGLAALAGGGGNYGLAALAGALENEEPISAPYTALAGGPRLVAAAKPSLEPSRPPTRTALERVAADARAAHGLVVIDAGRATDPAVSALQATASHVLFVVSASTQALARAEALGAAGVFTRTTTTQAHLVAVAPRPGRGPSLKQLRRLADHYVERLLLVPHLAGLAAGQPEQDARQLEFTYTALTSLLRSAR